ncbi:MAG: hypothetical protein IJP37_03730 [Clostridia bacterium]|nr:hypothetical protein [Clostridia bacterium]
MNKTFTFGSEEAYTMFREYRDAYTAEWQRLDRCERMYRGEHWADVPMEYPNEPRPVTPIIQSTIENVRADLMDQLPEAVITADDPDYENIAELLSAVIRENHAECAFEQEYARLAHDLLVGGYMVQEVGYDPSANGGLGGAFLRAVDSRAIMFDPCCEDIQDSRAIFKFTPHPRAWFRARYPELAGEMEADFFENTRPEDPVLYPKQSERILLIECWVREYDRDANRYRVHMMKLGGGKLLEDSRNTKPEGYFAHGKYPFTVTPLFPRKGTALGYGFVDMFETQQKFSDKLDQIVMKNALMASRNKLLVTGASGFDIDDLRDWSKEVHRGENLNGVTWFSTPPLPAYILSYIGSIRESIKEESGSNDFSRGGTTNGVTAASAIAALQEMSAKRSRTASRAMHGAFAEAVRMEIEVEREFAAFSREFTLKNGGTPRRTSFRAELLMKKTRLKNHLPLEFKVSVKVQRENRAAVAAHNELIFKMVHSGMITPEIGLQLIMFDAKAEALALLEQQKKAAAQLAAAQRQAIPAGFANLPMGG